MREKFHPHETHLARLPRPRLVRKNFQDSPSHRIFGRMHGVLNIDKNKNQLHSLHVICEMILLSLITE